MENGRMHVRTGCILVTLDTVPAVIVILNGDFDTLTLIRDEICGDNPVPTVLVKESGGLADLLAYARQHHEEIQIQR